MVPYAASGTLSCGLNEPFDLSVTNMLDEINNIQKLFLVSNLFECFLLLMRKRKLINYNFSTCSLSFVAIDLIFYFIFKAAIYSCRYIVVKLSYGILFISLLILLNNFQFQKYILLIVT